MSWQRAIQASLVANVPALLVGDPGIGKTSYLYALSKALERHAETVIASLREPSDFLGLPIIAGDQVRMAPPSWAVRLAERAGNGILILDEITTAPPAVQAALLRVVLERMVGDLQLPAETRIIAICNAADQVQGWELSLPLSNRFFHIEASAPDPLKWATGLQDDWATPPTIERLSLLEENVSKAKALIGGFLSTRPSLMLKVPKTDSKDQSAWPSPRSWTNATRLLGVALGDPELTNEVLMGTVGQGVALEFISWQKTLDLPTPEDLIAKPHKFKAPSRIDKTFVILDGLAVYVVGLVQGMPDSKADDVWLRAWQILEAVCKAGQPDVAMAAAKKILTIKRPAFTVPHSALNHFGELLRGIA
jgi:AAA domain (dynein-related subfamily)